MGPIFFKTLFLWDKHLESYFHHIVIFPFVNSKFLIFLPFDIIDIKIELVINTHIYKVSFINQVMCVDQAVVHIIFVFVYVFKKYSLK